MALYIKCNEKTYQAIGAPAERVRLEDGNHIAWQADFARFEEWPDMRAIAARTGSLLLQPSEAREEQDGVCCRELPEASDERFRTGAGTEEPEPESGSAKGADADETPGVTETAGAEEGGEA